MTGTSTANPQQAAAAVWTDDMSVGVPEIDADHQILIELVAQVADAGAGDEVQAVVGTVLAALSDYTDYHFSREELMMEALGYPEVPDHRASHQSLRRQVADYMARFSRDPDSVDIGELSEFLRQWLVHHILKEDMLYKPVAAGNPKAGEACQLIGVGFFLEDDEKAS